MTEKVNRKLCPFCFNNPYLFRTRRGLFRHVYNYHLCDDRGRLVLSAKKVKQVLKEIPTGIKFIKISGQEELDDFLSDYINDFHNPSKRKSRLWNYVS